jgi:ATP-dependent Lhr-like helicase
VCAVALLDSVKKGELDRTPQTQQPLDILAQQIVAACLPETWDEQRLYETLARAWPYRDLTRADFDAVVALHTDGRSAYLHRDGVHQRLRATRRARITALTSGGAIPDTGQYRVVVEPEGTHVGSLDEDFSVEANIGDIIQLGNASWRILKVEPGVVRVADAKGSPPTVPFWVGEGPARTRELSAALARVRVGGQDPAWLQSEVGVDEDVAREMSGFLQEGARALGAIPTPECIVLERFFDESGGMQLVVHSPFGGRINRAWGLALRKRFCRGFGFELQAAANEEAIILSLGPQHSFALEDVFNYLNPASARDILVQALLAAPMFGTRWRWNAARSLLLSRTGHGGRRVPTPLLRMRAEDLLVKAFPQVLACPETLPPGDAPVPWEHPLVRQTIEDCLHEAMDVDGFLEVLRGIHDGSIRRVAVDTTEPSAFARGILNAMPYAFLDPAPLEERRTQAVMTRRHLPVELQDTLGALDADAVARVRDEAWPQPENADEVHEALSWMGYVRDDEAIESGWGEWLEDLRAAGRVTHEDEGPAAHWRAVEASRDPKTALRGRMEALGPVFAEDLAVDERLPLELEAEGVILRCRVEGRAAWCERRLLARIHRYTLERLRREIEPVTASDFWRFLACWQHADPMFRLEGPRGALEVVRKLAGFEAPAAEWESSILPARLNDSRAEWLDQLTLTGEVVWGRLWGRGNTAVRSAPICLLPRQDLEPWLALSRRTVSLEPEGLSTYSRLIAEALEKRGACFTQELERATGLLPSHFEMGLTQLIGHGMVTCDSFGGLRRLITPPSRRRGVLKASPLVPAGRWSRFRAPGTEGAMLRDDELTEFVAQRLLDRYGVVFRRLLERERIPVLWRDLVRVYRHLELKGDVRGGRFVQRFSGEQYARPEAVELLRRLRRKTLQIVAPVEAMERAPEGLQVAATDPLNLEGILTPEPRIPAIARRRVRVG